MSSELKGCPWCEGAAAIETDEEEFDASRGICTRCGACGPFVDLADFPTVKRAKAKAAELWNTRPSPAPGKDVVEAARVAALVALAEHGDTTDIQGLLVSGSGTGSIKPGALDKMVRAALASIPPQDERERIVAHIIAEVKRCEAHLKASGGTTGLADAIQAEADALRVVAKEIEDGAHLQTTTEQEEER